VWFGLHAFGVFEKQRIKNVSIRKIVEEVKVVSWNWLRFKAKSLDYNMYNWCLNPRACLGNRVNLIIKFSSVVVVVWVFFWLVLQCGCAASCGLCVYIVLVGIALFLLLLSRLGNSSAVDNMCIMY